MQNIPKTISWKYRLIELLFFTPLFIPYGWLAAKVGETEHKSECVRPYTINFSPPTEQPKIDTASQTSPDTWDVAQRLFILNPDLIDIGCLSSRTVAR